MVFRVRVVKLEEERMSVSGDLTSVYFRDLDGIHHIWYAASGQCYLSPLRPNTGQIYPNTTSAIYNSVVPLERRMGGMCRVSADQLILLVAIHGVQLRCLVGGFGQCLDYARDICRRYFTGREAKMWSRLESLVDRYYGRLEDHTCREVWMQGDRFTRTFIVTTRHLGQKVSPMSVL